MPAYWPDRAEQFKRLLRHFRGASPVLDLGCGPGVLLGQLKSIGVRGEGVEYLPQVAREAARRGFRVHRKEVLSFLRGAKRSAYGGIMASHIIEHLPPSRVPEFLRNCARALRPGGILVILAPNPRNIGVITQTFWGDLEHTRPYALHLLVRLVAGAGFEILSAGDDPYTRQPGFLHRPLNFVRRLIVGDYWQGSDLLVVARRAGK